MDSRSYQVEIRCRNAPVSRSRRIREFLRRILGRISDWIRAKPSDDCEDDEKLWRRPSLAAPVRNWKSLPSREKVKLIKARPLPFVAGHVIRGKRNTRRYTIRVTPPRDGLLEFNHEFAIEIVAIAGSKIEALRAVATEIGSISPKSAGKASPVRDVHSVF